MQSINVGEMIISQGPEDTIVAPAIGSGLAVVVYDSQARAGGILHLLLPDSSVVGRAKAEEFPFVYADIGLPLFLDQVSARGMQKPHLHIILAGGAQPVDSSAFLTLGQRNHDAVLQILDEHGLAVDKAEVGGHVTRSIEMTISSGAIHLEIRGRGVRTL